MQSRIKYIVAYISAVTLVTLLLVNIAQAQEPKRVISVEAVEGEAMQAELDQLLAPIALYPDSVLSHILVASTYPLELVQAARWREENSHLDEEDALDAVEDLDWDPSVKALVPFTDLLGQLVDDLNWLQDLGDAFLEDETLLLTRVQALRRAAYDQGSLHNNKYVEVVQQQQDIIIQPVDERIIYVPYYDTRVVYGDWWWNDYPPYYWHRPAHYYWHAGLYWSPRVYLRHSVFFSQFAWHHHHVVVNYHNRRHVDDGRRRVRVTEYQRWSHNPHHRKGVRYHRKVAEHHGATLSQGRKVVRNREGHTVVRTNKVVRDSRAATQKAINTQKNMRKMRAVDNVISQQQHPSVRADRQRNKRPQHTPEPAPVALPEKRNFATDEHRKSAPKVNLHRQPQGAEKPPERSTTQRRSVHRNVKPQHRQVQPRTHREKSVIRREK